MSDKEVLVGNLKVFVLYKNGNFVIFLLYVFIGFWSYFKWKCNVRMWCLCESLFFIKIFNMVVYKDGKYYG